MKFAYDKDMLPLHDVVVYNPANNGTRDPDTNYHEVDSEATIDDKMTVQYDRTYSLRH